MIHQFVQKNQEFDDCANPLEDQAVNKVFFYVAMNAGRALALLFLLLTFGVNAQNREVETLNQEVMSLYSRGAFDRALMMAKKSLQF